MLETVKIMAIAGTIAAIGIYHLYFPDTKHSNPVEIAVEKVLEYETGVHIDLTPLDRIK